MLMHVSDQSHDGQGKDQGGNFDDEPRLSQK